MAYFIFWDAKGILMMSLDALGLGKDKLENEVRQFVGDEKFDAAMKGFDLVQTFVQEGPMAVWEDIKAEITQTTENLKATFFTSLRDWFLTTVAYKGIEKLVKIFIPGGGFLTVIEMVYDAINTILENAERLRAVIQVLIGSVNDIKNGNIGPAIGKIKEVLNGLATVGISFIAKFLGLNKITDHIKKVIEKIKDKIQEIIDKVKAFLKKKINAFLGKGGGNNGTDNKEGTQDNKEGNLQEGSIIGEEVPFTAQEHGKLKSHKVYAIVKGGKAEVIVRSTPTVIPNKLITWKGKVQSLSTNNQTRAKQLIEDTRKHYFIVKKEAQKSLEKLFLIG